MLLRRAPESCRSGDMICVCRRWPHQLPIQGAQTAMRTNSLSLTFPHASLHQAAGFLHLLHSDFLFLYWSYSCKFTRRISTALWQKIDTQGPPPAFIDVPRNDDSSLKVPKLVSAQPQWWAYEDEFGFDKFLSFKSYVYWHEGHEARSARDPFGLSQSASWRLQRNLGEALLPQNRRRANIPPAILP